MIINDFIDGSYDLNHGLLNITSWSNNVCDMLNFPIAANPEDLNIVKVKEIFANLPKTLREFRDVYANNSDNIEPMVFKNAAIEWPDYQLTPEFLANKYGDLPLIVSLDNMRTENNDIFSFQERTRNGRIEMTVKEFMYDLIFNQYQAGHFVGKGLDFWSNFSEILSGCYLPDPENISVENNLFIVHKNKITTLHNHATTFLALFYGAKLVTMINPIYKDYIYCNTSHEDDPLKCSSLINALNPDLEKYPNFRKTIIHQTILYPGDVLFIPDHWFHQVLSIKASISMTMFVSKHSKPVWNDFSELFKATHCLTIPIVAKDNPVKIDPVYELNQELPLLYSDFNQIYGNNKIVIDPILFREAAINWENINLNLRSLIKDYGDLPIEYYSKSPITKTLDPNARINNGTMLMKSFIELLKDNPQKSFFVTSNSKEFWRNYSNILTGSHFPDSKCKAQEYDFFIIPKNKITYLHNHKATFLALFDGIKLVTLIDSKYKDSIYCSTSYVNEPLKCASFIDVINPDLNKYPDFAKVTMKQVIMYPGDVLFIPAYYFHHVISLENSISMSKFISNRDFKNCN